MTDGDAQDFQSAFWAAKRAIATASEAAFGRHGVRAGELAILLTREMATLTEPALGSLGADERARLVRQLGEIRENLMASAPE